MRTLDAPTVRPLKAYAFDPTRGRALGNYLQLDVPFEPLQEGPVGRLLAVIDYDASNDCYYEPVDLDSRAVMLSGGLDPSESDPRFHQQMVYAVASETIRRFEFALGRSIRWRFARWRGRSSPAVERLRVLPHAMQEANAYYSRDLRALLFGYFPAEAADVGRNLPGQTVFTCLSHDIVAHETTHALVDSQRDFFMEPTSPDAPAFHEAFADVVALFQHFSHRDALLEMILRTGGRIFRSEVGPEVAPTDEGPTFAPELTTENPLVALAQQFGEAMGMRRALRSALGTPPTPEALQTEFEPHFRGAILVAAVFDAFFSIYVRRTADLMRIARAGGAATRADLHPDLAARLADEAAKHAERFLTICVRALDYCPPIDIRFGDFLRSLITADYDLVRDDPAGYRAALVDGFRARGIAPEGVASYAEESLRWTPPDGAGGRTPPRCTGLTFDVFASSDPANRAKRERRNALALHAFAKRHAAMLGLDPSAPIQARTFHQVHRVAPDGRVRFDMVAELMQRRDVPIDGNAPAHGSFTFRGGTTVILDRDGLVRYAIAKPLGNARDAGAASAARLAQQRAYLAGAIAGRAGGAYLTERSPHVGPMDFGLVHRGF